MGEYPQARRRLPPHSLHQQVRGEGEDERFLEVKQAGGAGEQFHWRAVRQHEGEGGDASLLRGK